MAQGSNELNLLLKAKVVKVKVELDIAGSGLVGQVNNITKFLKDKRVKLKVELETTGLASEVQKINKFMTENKKKVKIGVELGYNAKDINKQINAIATTIKGSKTGLSDLKIGVSIDVKGTASKIKKQLAEINKVVQEFNTNYAKQIKQMQDQTQKMQTQQPKNTNTNTGGSNKSPASTIIADANAYAKSLKDAQQYMRNQFGKGMFSSNELKDANGQLTGFIGTLTKANGVVQKIRYEWDANANKFTPINRQTVTTTEKTVADALKSLRELDREISKLGNSQGKFWQESNALKAQSANGTLTQQAVDALKTRIKDEQVLQAQIKAENALLKQQKELLADIRRESKNTKSSSYKGELGNIKNIVTSVNLDDTMAKSQLDNLRSSFKALKQDYSQSVKKEKDLVNAMEKRKDVLAEIARIEKSSSLNSTSGSASKRYIEETKVLAKNIKTMEDYNKVKARMDSTNRDLKSLKIDGDIDKQMAKLRTAMYTFATVTGQSLNTIQTRFDQVSHHVKGNLGDITNEIARYNKLTENFRVKQALTQRQNSIVGNADHDKVRALVNAKDNNALKEYIANLNGAQVAMMRLTTDSKGISRITAQFASTKKTAKEVVYEIDNVDKKLRQLSTAEVFNANRNLGVFEQLKIAMARVPVWMVAMTAFHGSINTVRTMTEEIFKLDKAMTELRRVADSQIDTEHMFRGAVELSKQLGNNIHDVMASVNDLARTFGHFNERQLLAITNTATLMSNVSDLNAQEATESLVGTMNAFNITAEDSIRIVDSMNEVDNNYAISTKQLATGLAKSASTAKTFGVEMEENIGHITAIGAVTMESGNIIGNSLKTIYSRITTMQGAKDVLAEVGVEVTDMAGNTKDVGDIIADLGGKWNTLSDSQRQNIAVTVAGRYQLSRFLALMNNFQMAQDSIDTAYNSQGSAMRENARYMESFEARINSLKTSFTEMTVSIGNAFLTGGLGVGIDVLTKMADVAVTVVDKFGVLPIVLGTIGIALLKFGVFAKTITGMKIAMTAVQTSFLTSTYRVNETTVATSRLGAVSRTVFASIRAGAVTASTAIKTMGTAMITAIGGFKGALASTGILAGFLVLGYAIEKIIGHFEKARLAQEEYENTTKKMIDSFRASGDGMQGMISEYETLADKKKNNITLTDEESQRLDELTRQFAEQLPTVVDYFDANGEAVLQSTEAIKEQIKAVSDLSKEQAKLKDMQLTENIKKEAKSYMDIVKEIEEQKKIVEEMQDKTYYRDEYGTEYEIDNTVNKQKETIKLMELEAQRREGMSQITKTIQEQTMAYLEANGMMVGFGDNQQALIEKFVTYNDELIRTADSQEEVATVSEEMVERGKELAGVFTEAYDVMSNRLDSKELEVYRGQLEAISASIPEDFLKIDADTPTASLIRIKSGMEEMINVAYHVQQGATDYDYLSGRLEAVGISSGQSAQMLGNLSSQFGNAELRADALRQSANGLAEGIDDATQSAIESINPIEALFGISTSDVGNVKSHLETLEILNDVKDKSTTQNMKYMDSLQAVSEYLNLAPSEIEANIHEYMLLADALTKVKTVMDEQGGVYLDLSAETSGLTEKQRELVGLWLEAGGNSDIWTGELLDTKNGLNEAKEAYNQAEAEMNEPIKPSIDTSLIDNSIEQSFANSIGYARDARAELDVNASVINKAYADLNSSTQALSGINDNIATTKSATEDLTEASKTTGTETVTAFSNMSTNVGTYTGNINTFVGGTVTAFQGLASQAGVTDGAIKNMNATAQNAITNVTTWKKKLDSLNGTSSSLLNQYYTSQGVTGESYSVSPMVSQSIASFSATAEGVASSGSIGGGEGTSGIIKSSAPTFEALHNTSGASKYSWKSSSSSSSSKATTKAKTTTQKKTAKAKTTTTTKEVEKTAKELAELYVVDLLERKKTQYQGTLSQIEAKISSLSVNTHKYRLAMLEAQEIEGVILNIDKQALAQAEKRNKEIEKRLSLLSNTGKHTEKQREEYNKLQSEYDSNLSKISQLKGEIDKTIVELRKKTEEIFIDFIDDIVSNIDGALKAVTDRIDDMDFELEVLELTDPENTVAKIDLMANKVGDLTKQQREYTLAMEELEVRLRYATSKFGIDSDAVKKLVEQMEQYEESWEDVRLEILRTEKEIRDMRLEIADKMIESTKKLHEQTRDSAIKTKDIEIDNAKKAHDAKMEMYDKESERISELYDQRIKALDDNYNEETYQADVAEKSNEISKLQQKVVSYSGDTSLEGKKRLAEAQKELEEKQKELNEFMKKHHLDALKEQLQEEKELQLEKVTTQKELDQEAHDTFIEQLEAEKEAISVHYEGVIEDEKKWSKIREELMKGNFKVVNELLQDMGINLEQMSDGTFNTLSEGFGEYSQEVRDFVLEINDMINQINAMTKTAYGDIKVPSNPTVSIGEPIAPVSVSSLIQKAYSGEKLMTPTEDKTRLYNMIQQSGIPEYRMTEIWRKAQSGITLDVPTPESMKFYNLFEDILKSSKLKRFNTGGYTGNNVPKSGGLAILDNKELVLNDKQTSHILSAVKLLDKVKSLVPEVIRNNMAGEFATTGTLNTNTNYNLTVNIDSLNGDKSGATTVVKEIMKNLKKMGR